MDKQLVDWDRWYTPAVIRDVSRKIDKPNNTTKQAKSNTSTVLNIDKKNISDFTKENNKEIDKYIDNNCNEERFEALFSIAQKTRNGIDKKTFKKLINSIIQNIVRERGLAQTVEDREEKDIRQQPHECKGDKRD